MFETLIWAALLFGVLMVGAFTVFFVIVSRKAFSMMTAIQDDLMRDTFEHWGKRAKDEE